LHAIERNVFTAEVPAVGIAGNCDEQSCAVGAATTV
jgi:hypothetical protein